MKQIESENEEEISFSGELCTFAVTGQHTTFQPIYICITCCDIDDNATSSDDSNDRKMACVCQSCAFICHADKGHEIRYVGIGACYCDCEQTLKECCLFKHSKDVALKKEICAMSNDKGFYLECDSEDSTVTSFPFVFGAYSIPCLREGNNIFCSELIREAMIMVKHTKETHWISMNTLVQEEEEEEEQKSHNEKFCGLELLAQLIFQQHCRIHNLDNLNNDKTENRIAGAEWWVQVKPVSTKSEDMSQISSEGIHLHYDKDEELAESFGLGSFPTLSTVTYLTHSAKHINQSPTIIVPHMYHDEEEKSISQCIISHPIRGKHIVFDGRLLHGVPSNPELRQTNHDNNDLIDETNDGECSSDESEVDSYQSYRVTFLVNIWIGTKPSGIYPLDPSIRNQILSKTNENPDASENSTMNTKFVFSNFISEEKPSFCLKEESIDSYSVQKNDFDTEKMNRIFLPFVSTDHQEDEDTSHENKKEEKDESEGDLNGMNSGIDERNDNHEQCNENESNVSLEIDEIYEEDYYSEEEEGPDLVLSMYPPSNLKNKKSELYSDTIHFRYEGKDLQLNLLRTDLSQNEEIN